MPLLSVADLRAEGVTLAQASDDQLARAILLAIQTVEDYTGRWFEAREFTDDAPLTVDSSGGSVLHLPVPIIRLDEVWEKDTQLDIATLEYQTVFDQAAYPNRIFNPTLTKAPIPGCVFSGFEVYGGPGTRSSAITRPTWQPGKAYVRLVGSFGFVGRDGVHPPIDIRMAAIMTALMWKSPLTSAQFRVDHPIGVATSESTDGHSYSLGAGLIASAGPTGNPIIDNIIAKYKRRNSGGSTRTR